VNRAQEQPVTRWTPACIPDSLRARRSESGTSVRGYHAAESALRAVVAGAPLGTRRPAHLPRSNDRPCQQIGRECSLRSSRPRRDWQGCAAQ
jgi:hypothetical protein